jgi:sugar lactone lactonase YvrE
MRLKCGPNIAADDARHGRGGVLTLAGRSGATATLAAFVCTCVGIAGCGERGSGAAGGSPIKFEVCFGEVGMSPGQFSYPRAVDSDGTSLWVIDKAARVQRMDPRTGATLSGWRMPEWTGGKPTGITVWTPAGGGPDDVTVFVADTHYNRIMVYQMGPTILAPGEKDPGNDGTAWGAPVHLVSKFGSYGTQPGQLTYPTDVAVLPTDDGTRVKRLYVSEYGGTDRISIFEPREESGKTSYVCTGTFGRFGSGSEASQIEFSRPQSMVIDLRQQELIIADACNHRLGRFTLDGELIAWISSPDAAGKELGRFNYPYGLCLLDDRTILVAEYGNNRIQHVNLDTGQGLRVFGQAGRGTGQLAIPWGIAAVGNQAFVLDSGNNRVMGFEAPAKARIFAADEAGVKGAS